MEVDQVDQGAAAVLLQHWEVLSLLAGKLKRRDARSALAAALLALSRLLTGSVDPDQQQQYSTTATAMVDLNSWVEGTLDEADYDRRLACYRGLTKDTWSNFDRLQALPVLLHAFQDLRSASDLALRQGAAAALVNCVQALTRFDQSKESNAAAADAPNSPARLLPRVLYPQTKLGLRSSSLAVRQEHLSLLRFMVVTLPGRFPDLVCLTSPDTERDFLLNVGHLQVHRRGRALLQLARMLKQHQQQQEEGQQEEGQQQVDAMEVDGSHHDNQQQEQQEQQQEPQPSQAASRPAAAAAPGAAAAAAAAAAPSVRVLVDVASPLLQQFILEAGGGGGSGGGAGESGHDKRQADLDRWVAAGDRSLGV
jgi:U3 small nucleolar RNA-associated protein 20